MPKLPTLPIAPKLLPPQISNSAPPQPQELLPISKESSESSRDSSDQDDADEGVKNETETEPETEPEPEPEPESDTDTDTDTDTDIEPETVSGVESESRSEQDQDLDRESEPPISQLGEQFSLSSVESSPSSAESISSSEDDDSSGLQEGSHETESDVEVEVSPRRDFESDDSGRDHLENVKPKKKIIRIKKTRTKSIKTNVNHNGTFRKSVLIGSKENSKQSGGFSKFASSEFAKTN